jgi:hypothetical protein
MQADFKCPKCSEVLRDEVMPEMPVCVCGGYMREVKGTRKGELSIGMQRMINEYRMETDL